MKSINLIKKNSINEFRISKSEVVWQPDKVLIMNVTTRFCKNNSIQPYSQEDLVQYVNLRLLEGLTKIQSNYKGEAKVKTYLSAVILNLCREFRRKNCSKSVFTVSDIEGTEIQDNLQAESKVVNSIYIKSELKRLGYIMQLLGTKKSKIWLSLKIYFALRLFKSDFYAYLKDSRKAENYLALSEPINFKQKMTSIDFLNKMFNEIEAKESTSDATRKWVDRQLSRVLDMLNTGGRAHNKETLNILMELQNSNGNG